MPNRAALWRARVASETGSEKPVVERARTGLTVDLGGGARRLMRSVGPIHTLDGREIDTDWQDDTGDFIAKGKSLDFDPRVRTNGQRRFTPRLDHPDEYVDSDRPEWYTNRWANVPFANIERVENRYLLSSPGYSLTVAIKPDGVKAVWTIDSLADLHPFRYALTFVGLTYNPVTNTAVSNSDGQTVLWLGTPLWWDAEGKGGVLDSAWDGTYLVYTPSIPADAAYPVMLDPDFGTSIATGNDDGYVQSTTFDRAGAYLYCGEGSSNAYSSWYRFQNLTIAKGATVSVAHIDQYKHTNAGSGNVTTTIYLVDEDDHTAPASKADWDTDHGAHTSASASYVFDPSAASAPFTSANFASAAQEVFARDNWTSGYDIGVHIDCTGTGHDHYIRWAAYENTEETREPELDITYSTAVNATATPTALSITLTCNQATRSGGALRAPAAYAASLTMPQAGRSGSALVLAVAYNLIVTFPQTKTSISVTVYPPVLSIGVTLPPPGRSGNAARAPPALSTPVTFPQAGRAGSALRAPAALQVAVTAGAAAAHGAAVAKPAVLAVPVTAGQATARGAAVAAPAAFNIVVTLPAATVAASATVVPVSLNVVLAADHPWAAPTDDLTFEPSPCSDDAFATAEVLVVDDVEIGVWS